MKNAEDIMHDFLQDYQQDPEGWNFWITESDQFYSLYLTHHDESYFIKLDSIYTQNPLGMGKKVKTEKDQLKQKLPGYGFRKFNQKELQGFINMMSELGENEEQKKIEQANETIQRKMSEKPSLPSEKGAFLIGPHQQGNPFHYRSEEQKKVERKLKKRLNRLFRKKYPMYG